MIWLGSEMNSANSRSSAQRETKLIRVPLIINFLLMLALIGPGSSHTLDLALRKAGIENAITLAVQGWMIGSTLFATGFFVWRLVRKSHAIVDQPTRPTKLDWGLLLGWWFFLIVLGMFAFNMGMGG
jgi:hypothetical protein